MKNIYHKNNLNRGTGQLHVNPAPIPLIKNKNNEKLDKYCVKIKFYRDPTLQKSDLYELKWPSLITASWRGYCYSSVIST